jgi:hypothetical protein
METDTAEAALRELDAGLALALGWFWLRVDGEDYLAPPGLGPYADESASDGTNRSQCWDDYCDDNRGTVQVPFFATDWEATGDLVAAMRERGWYLSTTDSGPGLSLPYCALFAKCGAEGQALGRTLPEAVARAALAALATEGGGDA